MRLFALALAAADLGGYWLVRWYMSWNTETIGQGLREGLLMMASLYLCSLPPFCWCTKIWRWRVPIRLAKWTIVSSLFGNHPPAAGCSGQLRGGLPVPAAVV